jgi:hypothetical protein
MLERTATDVLISSRTQAQKKEESIWRGSGRGEEREREGEGEKL